MCAFKRRLTNQESDSANTAASSSSTRDARGASSGSGSRSRGTPRAVISTDGAGVAEPSVARATASSAGARKRRRSSAFADEAPVPLRNASRLSRSSFSSAANRSATRRARAASRSAYAARRADSARHAAWRAGSARHAPKRRTKGFSVRIAISSSAARSVPRGADGPLRLGDFNQPRARVSRHGGAARLAVRVKSRQDVVRRGDASERRRDVRRLRGGQSVHLRGGDELSRNDVYARKTPPRLVRLAELVSLLASGLSSVDQRRRLRLVRVVFEEVSLFERRDAPRRERPRVRRVGERLIHDVLLRSKRVARRVQLRLQRLDVHVRRRRQHALDASLQIGDARLERFHPRDETVVRVTRTVVPLVKRRHVHQVQQRTTRGAIDSCALSVVVRVVCSTLVSSVVERSVSRSSSNDANRSA